MYLTWEVLDTRHVVDAELHPKDQIIVQNIILAIRPSSNALAAAALVSIPAASVQLPIAMLGDVDVVVRKLRSLEVERAGVRQDGLEGWHVDLVGYWLVVDWVSRGGVLDLEDTVGGEVEI